LWQQQSWQRSYEGRQGQRRGGSDNDEGSGNSDNSGGEFIIIFLLAMVRDDRERK
jgi:hypothetical protein